MDHEISAKNNGLRWHGFLIALLCLFSAFLSLAFFLGQSIRFEEAQNLFASSKSFLSTITGAAANFQSPLYLLMLYLWQLVFGPNIALARVLSLLFFLASIVAIYRLGKESFNAKLGFFVALLFSLSPFMQWFANEALPYSALAFICIVSQVFFVQLLEGENKALPRLFLVSVIGLYLDYFFGLVLAAQLIFALIFSGKFRDIFPKVAKVFVLSMLLYLPWFLYLIFTGNPSAVSAARQASSVSVFNAFSNFLFGFNQESLNTIIVSFWPIALLLAFLALRERKLPSHLAIFFAVSIVVPLLGLLAASFLLEPIFSSQYLIVIVPSLYLFLVAMLVRYPRLLFGWLVGGLAVLSLVFLGIQVASSQTSAKEDYQQASQYLQQNAGVNDVIVLSSPYAIFPFEYYYHGPAQLATIPEWNPSQQSEPPEFSTGRLAGEAGAFKNQYQRLWLVVLEDQGNSQAIKTYFDTHYEEIYRMNFSPGLDLYVYKLNYTND